MATPRKFLYRCNQFSQATGYDDDRDVSTGCVVRVAIHSYPITKATKRGVWIDVYHEKRWVSSYSKKRFAYPSKIGAINNFRKRKERQISILSQQLAQAREALTMSPKDYLDCSDTFT